MSYKQMDNANIITQKINAIFYIIKLTADLMKKIQF